MSSCGATSFPGAGNVKSVTICPDVLRVSKQLVAWSTMQHTNLLKTCLDQWRSMHRTVVAASCPTIAFPLTTPALTNTRTRSSTKTVPKAAAKQITTTPKPSECELAGMCVHKGSGLRLYMFRNVVLSQLKAIFPPKTSLRQQLLDGFIIVMFHASVLGHTDIGALPPSDQTVCLHIGMQYLSPYRPTFHKVYVDDDATAELGTLQRVWFKVNICLL